MADSLKQMTVIGPDTKIKGEMSFDSSARILGTFEGKVSASGEVHIGEGALCKAQVDAARIVVDGVVEGNLNARETIQLNAKAKITGDISAATLVVAAGASFVGQVRVGPAFQNGTQPGAAAAPQMAASMGMEAKPASRATLRPPPVEIPGDLREESMPEPVIANGAAGMIGLGAPPARPLWPTAPATPVR